MIIDTIVNEVYIKHPENKNTNRFADAWKQHDIVGYLAFNPKIMGILQKLYNRKPIPFQTLNFYTGTEQRLHSDQIHFCSDPVNLMCGVWIALEDISMDSGPLIYYPKSHKLPFYTMQSLNIEPGNYREYENKIHEIVTKLDLKPKYGVIKKGDIIIWHANLIHGGSKRNNPNITRKSIVIHYFFENCKYWTPLLSTTNNIIYRNPSDFVNPKFNLNNNNNNNNNTKLYTSNDLIYAKTYKERYSDLQNLTDEQAIEHYYAHGIFENRIFFDK
jgi:ectoine hydroxylase-related dioxygenase (phytanoyl-CoA dioxygenase family)